MSAASIMIVEDDADVRETMAQVLESEGHRVTTARDGTDALEAFARGERPELIVLDLMMPGMNGWDLRAALRRDPELASVPVIVVSAIPPGSERLGELDAVEILHKPFELDTLLAAVDRALPYAGAPPTV
jgi:CheY-like chemotaxis protein